MFLTLEQKVCRTLDLFPDFLFQIRKCFPDCKRVKFCLCQVNKIYTHCIPGNFKQYSGRVFTENQQITFALVSLQVP